jgi:ABC-2 type transport system permease protein
VALISLAIVSVIGYAVGWRTSHGLPSLIGGFALVVVFIYAMLWVGALLGLALKNAEAIDSIGAIVLVLFSFLSNAFILVKGLPGWVQPIADWNPLSCVIDACRQLWGNPVTASDGGFPAAHPALMTIVSLGVIILLAVPFSMSAYRRAVAQLIGAFP